jgi:hypothetical protein
MPQFISCSYPLPVQHCTTHIKVIPYFFFQFTPFTSVEKTRHSNVAECRGPQQFSQTLILKDNIIVLTKTFLTELKGINKYYSIHNFADKGQKESLRLIILHQIMAAALPNSTLVTQHANCPSRNWCYNLLLFSAWLHHRRDKTMLYAKP